MTPEHHELTLAAAYVLGSLDHGERESFESHLRTCDECQAEVRSLERVTLALAAGVPERTPRPELRARLLEAVQGQSKGQSAPQTTSAERDTAQDTPQAWPDRERRAAPGGGLPLRWPSISVWMPAAALLALAIGLGAHAQGLRTQIADLEDRLMLAEREVETARATAAGAQGEVVRVQHALSVLASADMARVELLGQKVAPSARARVFWSRQRGLVFTAHDLPAPPAGKVYQVWVLTSGAPISAGLMSPDGAGETAIHLDTAATIPPPTGVAVSLEPQGGVPAPTGDIYLAGLVGA